ncbi:MAG: hypothetical protein ACK2TX_09715, partial [Anaerolineales bacterium]
VVAGIAVDDKLGENNALCRFGVNLHGCTRDRHSRDNPANLSVVRVTGAVSGTRALLFSLKP